MKTSGERRARVSFYLKQRDQRGKQNTPPVTAAVCCCSLCSFRLIRAFTTVPFISLQLNGTEQIEQRTHKESSILSGTVMS